MSLRRETTILRFSTSILRILHSTSLPMNRLMSPGLRISTCEAGRKTGTPISTSRPPLIRRMTLPLTTSPSFLVLMMFSQPRILSALRLLSRISAAFGIRIFQQDLDRPARARYPRGRRIRRHRPRLRS